MASPFVMVCLGLITLAVWVGLIIFFVAFIEIRRALQAVEAVAYRLLETAEKLRHASLKVEDFAANVRSGWMKAFEVAIGAAQTFWPHREKAQAAESASNDNNN